MRSRAACTVTGGAGAGARAGIICVLIPSILAPCPSVSQRGSFFQHSVFVVVTGGGGGGGGGTSVATKPHIIVGVHDCIEH
jgi:hypothetical protein